MVAIAWYWLAGIVVLCGLVGWMGAAMLGRLRLDDAETQAMQWAYEHAKVVKQFAELDNRAQKMFGKLCKKEAEIAELRREIAALKGEPIPGEPKAGGTAEEVASIIRDLQDEGIVPVGQLTTMELTG